MTDLLIFLQQLPSVPTGGEDILKYGGGLVGGGGGFFLIKKIIEILSKLTSISEDIANIKKRINGTDENKETQKKKIEELHEILTEKNDNGQRLIHAPYFFLKEFAKIQAEISKETSENHKEMTKSIIELVSIHKEQSKFQETIINKLTVS